MRISDWSSDVCSSDLAFCCAATVGARNSMIDPPYVRSIYYVNRSMHVVLQAMAAPVHSIRRFRPATCGRSEEHTSELQSLMRISYAVLCLKKKKMTYHHSNTHSTQNLNIHDKRNTAYKLTNTTTPKQS